ncbi:MAG: hypothetical protein V4658_05800 [Bacteroidota bacterium]
MNPGRQILKLTAIAFSLILLMNGCTKGDEGVPGTPGKNGAANISSRTFTVDNWLYTSPYHYVNLNVPELTSANLNSAGVMVYFTTKGINWIAVPYTQFAATNYFMGFETSTGNVKITWFYDSSVESGNNPNVYYNTKVQYKVVIIPAADRVLKPNVNYKNYQEVKASFRLND